MRQKKEKQRGGVGEGDLHAINYEERGFQGSLLFGALSFINK